MQSPLILRDVPQILRRRAQTIRMQKKEISDATGLDQGTIHRTFEATTDPRLSTLIAIEEAIEAREAEVRQAVPYLGGASS